MPEISRFFGIIITMYYNDHAPPHFHIRYGQHKALVAIETQAVIQGSLSNRAFNLVAEWALMHQAELMENWNLARQNQVLNTIEPLE
jgi:hypothetical protein